MGLERLLVIKDGRALNKLGTAGFKKKVNRDSNKIYSAFNSVEVSFSQIDFTSRDNTPAQEEIRVMSPSVVILNFGKEFRTLPLAAIVSIKIIFKTLTIATFNLSFPFFTLAYPNEEALGQWFSNFAIWE